MSEGLERGPASSKGGPSRVARTLRIGTLDLWPPVVLAPMAGVTDSPFRRLCREMGAPCCVSEMITAGPLIEGNRKTLELLRFADDESPCSVQLYGRDPAVIGEAVRRLVDGHGVEHIDLNFGCPVRKVTRKGGGAAIPADTDLLARIVRAAIASAGPVPVTMKFRMGIDEDHMTHLEAGRIGQEEGCAAVALHARTAAQLYSGRARWPAIAELKRRITHIPVLGNGDIWVAQDALSMMDQTGCDGVVIGRGCLGRPWLFNELVAAFDGQDQPTAPCFGQVRDVMLDHARRLCEWRGESAGLRAFRKHAGWYTKGFRTSEALRPLLMKVSSLQEIAALLDSCDPDEPYPQQVLGEPRGKSSPPQRVALPSGFLDRAEAGSHRP